MKDIEGRIRALRPAGPPEHLRANIVSAARRARSSPRELVWWLPAAAAAAAVLVFSFLDIRVDVRIDHLVAAADTGRPSLVDDLARTFGDDASARVTAEYVINVDDAGAQGAPSGVDDFVNLHD